MVLGAWQGAALQVPAWLHREIPASQIVSRLYRNDDDELVHVFFIASTKPQAFHRATICYPGQGWMVERRQVVPLDADGEAECLIVRRKEVRIALLSWYESGRRTTCSVHRARLWLRLGRLLGTSEGAGRFVRLATPIPVGEGGEYEGLSRLVGFAQLVCAARRASGNEGPAP